MPSTRKRKKRKAEGTPKTEEATGAAAAAAVASGDDKEKPKTPKKREKHRPKELGYLAKYTPKAWMATGSDTKRTKFSVRRYSFGTKLPPEPPTIVIKKGKGTKLKHIQAVESEINSRRVRDPALTTLHRLLFTRATKGVPVKDNLLAFSGVTFDEDENPRERMLRRVVSLHLSVLRDICDLLNVDSAGDRDELADRVVDFLERPRDTGRQPQRKRRASTSSHESSHRSSKRRKTSKDKIKRPRTAFLFFTLAAREKCLKKHPGESVTEIAKRMGRMWRQMSDTEKEPYERQAERDKKRYAEEKKRAEEASSESASDSASESSGSSTDEDADHKKDRDRDRDRRDSRSSRSSRGGDRDRERDREKEKEERESERERDRDREKERDRDSREDSHESTRERERDKEKDSREKGKEERETDKDRDKKGSCKRT
eukprot:TRINITY_DN255_c0_g1_i5.p1 TRINITY_DN255_c0_g1~~TRINITY_DN255_c0_g1_i5.p1  ORF type:complete len:430 (+),score=120.69 TRINITY_DN255_c0_g1_i5:155-1444(+)